ncbi:MAG: ATP-binding cassette domain-containing protein, partial [Clostridia bacterium]
MKREKLRVAHLSKSKQDYAILEDINLHVYEGEALGILGIHDAGKSTLLNILSGREAFDQGAISLDETPIQGRRMRLGNEIALVKCQSSLVSNLTVAENIFVLRRHNRPKVLLRTNLLESQAHIQLQGLGLDVKENARVSTLSDIERYIIEIVKAFILGAKVILIDDFAKDYPHNDYIQLGRVIDTLKAKGLSFIISGAQLGYLNAFCDRIAILSNKRITKIVKKDSTNNATLETALLGDHPGRVITSEKEPDGLGELVFSAENIRTRHAKDLTFSVRSGEIVVLNDPRKQANEELFALVQDPKLSHSGQMQAFGRPYDPALLHHRVAFTDFNMEKRFIDRMSVRDNLCLSCYPKFCECGVFQARRLRYVEQAFAQWYGDDSLLGLKQCSDLREQDKMAIYLFSLKLHATRLMFCVDPSLVTDYVTYQMI